MHLFLSRRSRSSVSVVPWHDARGPALSKCMCRSFRHFSEAVSLTDFAGINHTHARTHTHTHTHTHTTLTITDSSSVTLLAPICTCYRKEVKEQLTGKLSQQTNTSPPMMSDLTMSELNDAIRRLKNKKVPGKDGVSNEMIKHRGPASNTKLLEIFNPSCEKRESFHRLGKRPPSSPYPSKTGTPRRKPSIDPSACSAASTRPSSA